MRITKKLTRRVESKEELYLFLKKLRKKYPGAQLIGIEREHIPNLERYESWILGACAFAGLSIILLIVVPFHLPVALIALITGGNGINFGRLAVKVEKKIVRECLTENAKILALRFEVEEGRLKKMWIFYSPI